MLPLGLDIKLNTGVRQIRYSQTGVEVSTSNARNHTNPVTSIGGIQQSTSLLLISVVTVTKDLTYHVTHLHNRVPY